MTNTHRKTTNRTTAKIAAVGAFGLGAAIAFPGLAAAQATDPAASLAEITGEDGSLEGALGTDLKLDLGSLTFNLNLDAETPNPGSVELGSLGVSPNTGSALIDGESGSGSAAGEDNGDDADSGSLDAGSLTGGSDDATEGTGDVATAAAVEEAPATSGSLGSGDEAADETATEDTAAETGSLSGSLAGLSSGAEDEAPGVDPDAAAEATGTGSLG